MGDETDVWRPGSFTKNFSWGDRSAGLYQLHRIIKLGFAGEMADVPRALFRERVESAERPDFIPINFFLFNKTVEGVDLVIADELVFQALNSQHSPRFDKLALFAFNFTFAGKWTGSGASQRRPAMWAHAYILNRVFRDFDWDTRKISADDIDGFLKNSPQYAAKTTRKVSTNLNYLYTVGGLAGVSESRVERWWVDSMFLALDRLIEDRLLDRRETSSRDYASLLSHHHFLELTGKRTLEKDLAIKHLVRLYDACGGRSRFSDDAVAIRTELLVTDLEHFTKPNDGRPRGAVHPTNPKILKSIPAICAMLARYAGFVDLGPDALEEFDLEQFVRERTQSALNELRDRNIRPNLTAEELMRLTRER
jgi:hypothetical protein